MSICDAWMVRIGGRRATDPPRSWPPRAGPSKPDRGVVVLPTALTIASVSIAIGFLSVSSGLRQAKAKSMPRALRTIALPIAPSARNSPGALCPDVAEAGRNLARDPILRFAVRREVARMSEHARSEVRQMS
jgi:hypothetical protein